MTNEPVGSDASTRITRATAGAARHASRHDARYSVTDTPASELENQSSPVRIPSGLTANVHRDGIRLPADQE